MSFLISEKRPKEDAKPVDPIIGYLQICVNSTPVVRRFVTSSQKFAVLVELAHTACELWKLFGVACSLSLEFCKLSDDNRDVVLNFTR